ncbi:hypothetical protein ACFV08_00620 [Streptomyces fradiae]|uniref:hypothetical protein n=1 Tax=Streptomyces fradiae TaxID=1906 RepID=UPI003693395E
MTSENVTEAETVEAAEPQPARAVDDRLIEELVSRAHSAAPSICAHSPAVRSKTRGNWRARRLHQEPGHPRPKAHYRRSLTQLVPVAPDGRIKRDAFTALAAAPDPEQVAAMVRPSIEAHLALADRNDDGVVDV